MRAFRLLRRGLDGLYLACGVLAAGCLCAILVIIVAQMVARWTGHVFLGATAYAGYAMAASSFLAFAHALNRGAHIRVGLLLALAPRARRWIELWCFGVGAALGWFLARYAVNLAVGAVVFAVCLTDHLVRTAAGVDVTPPDLAELRE
jgi:TRAP-type C4-dicarboxylate transport system permease small subunit